MAKWKKPPIINGVEIKMDPSKGLGPIVAANIKRLRKAQGLSQEELGLRSGLADGTIGKLERLEINTTLDTVDRVATGLQLDSFLLCIPDKSRLGDNPKVPQDIGDSAKKSSDILREKEAGYLLNQLVTKLKDSDKESN